LKDVKVLNTDMPLKKRESIILLVCDCANKWNHKYDLVIEIKKRIEGVYGNVWNAFVVDGRFWSIYTHKPGSNLVFVSKGIGLNPSCLYRPAILREVEVLTTDMSAKKKESILLLVLEGVNKKKSKQLTIHCLCFINIQERLQEIKERIERVYGLGWNVFMADGRYWSVCSHKPGTNLVFVHKGIVYGVHQTPAPENAERDNCSVAH
uniref:DDE Tnp4 domain-containing protein n=1 Tax=Schistocephalus solidus TaxID=70667 RepID=A0A183SJD2_SCHSO